MRIQFDPPASNDSLIHRSSETDAVDYFQCVSQNGQVKIARLSRYFDTWNVTLALTNGVPFPQFTNNLAKERSTTLHSIVIGS